MIFFTLGSIVAAVAKNFTVLIVGRTLQGVGGGGVIALNEILITDLIPLRQRGAWLGILNSIWAIGTVAGPLVGGGLAQKGVYDYTFRKINQVPRTMLKDDVNSILGMAFLDQPPAMHCRIRNDHALSETSFRPAVTDEEAPPDRLARIGAVYRFPD